MTDFKIKRAVNLPLIKLVDDKPAYFKLTSEIYQGKKIVTGDKKKDAEEPAFLVKVIDLQSGEEGEIFAPEVLKGILEENYELDGSDSYVGRGFRITRHKKASGKRYNTFTVHELEL